MKSLTEKYHPGQGTITYWLQQHRKECQSNPQIQEENNSYEKSSAYAKNLMKRRKKMDFFKKRRLSLRRKSISQYQFIQKYKKISV